MFHFLSAPSTSERMSELERFLEFWYGPRKPEYGEPEERLRGKHLPGPLRRFHAFAGRWTPPEPGDLEFIYTGASGHHLLDLDGVEARPDGRLRFFMEYQGDWDGLTLPDEEDPPVWIEGRWEDDENGDEPTGNKGEKVRRVANALSAFLVTHCLLTSLYEWDNSPCSGWDGALARWFQKEHQDAVLIWEAEGTCPNYSGQVYLFHGSILVHKYGSSYHFGARHPEGVRLMKKHMKK